MNNDPTLSYQQAAVCGATPIGQIVALYDTILRDFARAIAALKAKDVEARVFELNHAITVIGHLQWILDHERGGEPAKIFERFYNMTRGMIMQANIRAEVEPIEELIHLYSEVRQAWYDAEQQSRAGRLEPATARPSDVAERATGNNADDSIESPQLQWSA